MRVACVIPHFGDDSLLRQCLSGIVSHYPNPEEPAETELEAGTMLMLPAGYDVKQVNPSRIHVEIVDNNKENRLFTRGVNAGIRRILNNPALDDISAIWILNNDCIPQPGCAGNAIVCMDEEARCGIVGCQNRLLSDPDKIVWGGSGAWYPVGKHKTGLVSAGHLQERTDEIWATFASVFISVDLIREIGLLDENLYHIGSDADYCLRARMAGWRVIHEPKSIVYHEMGSSSHCENQFLLDIMRKDSEYLEAKWVKGLFRGHADVKPNP